MSVSVNEGPTAIASAFLAKERVGKYDKRQVKKLRQVFGRFLKACEAALEVNESEIEASQFDYHRSLVEGYAQMRQMLVPLIATTSRRDGRPSSRTASSASFASVSEPSTPASATPSTPVSAPGTPGNKRASRQTGVEGTASEV